MVDTESMSRRLATSASANAPAVTRFESVCVIDLATLPAEIMPATWTGYSSATSESRLLYGSIVRAAVVFLKSWGTASPGTQVLRDSRTAEVHSAPSDNRTL